MIASLLCAAALATTNPAMPIATSAEDSGTVYKDLARSRTEAAIARILASKEFDSEDPATLINLGAAYERIGRKDRALAMYRAAIMSPDRYDLQLADGRWMDSREAARLAVDALKREAGFVLR
jgi:tetratricopeptide (TPR) repeat protein